MNLADYELKELSIEEAAELNGGWINPVAAYMGACYLAYELGHAVGEALYHMLN